jgi:HrpA-like RNA helicase
MCIHLIPCNMAQRHLAAYDPPEIKRMPLGDVCLLVKSLGFADIAAFLAGLPEAPPAAAAVAGAVADLQALSALDDQQQLTPLGRLLALLPGELLLVHQTGCIKNPHWLLCCVWHVAQCLLCGG